MSIPLIMGVVPPNRLYGFRTAATLSNDALWYRVNRFAGWAFFIAGIASGTLLLAIERGMLATWVPDVGAFLVPMVVAMIASWVYLRSVNGSETGGRK
jgi:SdpI/YfhL protein family